MFWWLRSPCQIACRLFSNAVVARELTKLHEEYRRGALPELAAGARQEPARGEIVLLVAPPDAAAVADTSDTAISARLASALGDMSLRDAAHVVAEAMGVPRARVYDLGLQLKRAAGGDKRGRDEA